MSSQRICQYPIRNRLNGICGKELEGRQLKYCFKHTCFARDDYLESRRANDTRNWRHNNPEDWRLRRNAYRSTSRFSKRFAYPVNGKMCWNIKLPQEDFSQLKVKTEELLSSHISPKLFEELRTIVKDLSDLLFSGESAKYAYSSMFVPYPYHIYLPFVVYVQFLNLVRKKISLKEKFPLLPNIKAISYCEDFIEIQISQKYQDTHSFATFIKAILKLPYLPEITPRPYIVIGKIPEDEHQIAAHKLASLMQLDELSELKSKGIDITVKLFNIPDLHEILCSIEKQVTGKQEVGKNLQVSELLQIFERFQ